MSNWPESSKRPESMASKRPHALTVDVGAWSTKEEGASQRPAAARRDAKRIAFATDGFSLVVVRHPTTRKWLAVNETKGRGWWLPAGHVDRGQSFLDAAHAETAEEAGARVVLKGVLAVEHTLVADDAARMRVVFYAEPRDPSAEVKTVPDSESLGAAWLSVDELRRKEGLPPPEGLRGTELLRWAEFIEAGGAFAPIETLQRECSGPGEGLWRLVGREKGGRAPNLFAEAVAAPEDGGGAMECGGGGGLLEAQKQLAAAVVRGDVECVRSACLAGADPSVPLNKKLWSALHHCADRGDAGLEMARTVLLAGANPNGTTHKGRTPLHFAACRGALDLIRCLLVAGCAPAARDSNGMRASELCDGAARALLQQAESLLAR